MVEKIIYKPSFSDNMTGLFTDKPTALRVASIWQSQHLTLRTSYAELLAKGATASFDYETLRTLAFLQETTFPLAAVPQALDLAETNEQQQRTAAEAFLTSYSLNAIIYPLEIARFQSFAIEEALSNGLIPHALQNHRQILQDVKVRQSIQPKSHHAQDLLLDITMALSNLTYANVTSSSNSWQALSPATFHAQIDAAPRVETPLAPLITDGPARKFNIARGELAAAYDTRTVAQVMSYLSSVPGLAAPDLVYFFEYAFFNKDMGRIAREYGLPNHSKIKAALLLRLRNVLREHIATCPDSNMRSIVAELFGIELSDDQRAISLLNKNFRTKNPTRVFRSLKREAFAS